MLRRPSYLAHRGGADQRARTGRRRGLIAAVGLLLVAASLQCKPQKPPNLDRVIGKGADRVDPKLLPNRVASDPKLPPNPPSFPLAIVPEKSVGPFLARHNDTAMAAYVGPGEGGGRRVISLPLGADGAPFDPQIVAPASADATMMILRTAGGDQGAYITAWTDLTDKGEALSVAGVTELGKPRSTPAELSRTQDDIVWIEVVPTDRGEVALWVEETKGGDANMFAVPLEPDGRPRGLPSAVVRGISGWQAVPTASGAGLAILLRKPAGTAKAAAARDATTTISWLELDADARAKGTPIVVGSTTQHVVDVDVARVGSDYVIAWTRRGAPEPEVMVAGVTSDGKITPARSISGRSGGGALVDAVGGVHGGVLAWEETTHFVRGTRRLHVVPLPVGRLPEAGVAGAKLVGAELNVDTAGVPEIVPLEHGAAVLARIRTCAEPPIPDVPCDDPPPSPTFIRLDDRYAVTETQPLFVDETPVHASLAWGLSCQGLECFVLAAGSEVPAEVRLVRLSPGVNRWRAPLTPAPPADAPRVLAVDTLASADLYSELAVGDVKGAPLVAAITTESAKSDGTLAATVTLASLDPSGAAHGPSVTLTHRARPEGGVSIAGAEGLDGAAVAWVGRVNGHAAVHVTRVDGTGKQTNEIQLTTAAGDTSDVALTWVRGGWVVVWVDTRDGNGEVYATKVDPQLRRIAREVRITNAPGDASDVTVMARPGKDGPIVWVAWADPRDSPKDGTADIFATRLSGADATPLGPEQRVLATVPHSRSPALAPGDGPSGSGASIAWIEEAPAGADPAGISVYGALIGALDDQCHLVGEPLRTRGAGEGFPTSITLDRAPAGLRIALARATRDDIFLDAMVLAPGAGALPYPLFGLEGPPSMDVALAIVGDGLYFNDQVAGSTDGRIRRATIDWRR
jgi:hypothetical protein